jgi:hypothetical protein
MTMLRTAFGTLALVLVTSHASALEESTRRPFYVQGTVASVALWTGFVAGDQAYWHPDVEFGVHFTGRHDGVVVGIRQAFDVGSAQWSLGETMLRGGYDIALPLRNGRFEITLAPFATFGVDYTLYRNLNAGVRVSLGIEGKLFFFQGLYLLLRPVELSIGEFVNLGPLQKNVYFNFNAGLGAGYAF